MVFVQPIVMGKAVDEFRVLENNCSVRSGATGQAADPTIDMGGSGDFDVPDSQTESRKNLPDGEFLPDRLNSL